MDNRVRLIRVILPVSDINKAVSFYATVLATPGERVSAGRHYFDCGGTILACFDPKADGDKFEARPNPDHIYFAVPDLEACYARARGAECSSIGDIKDWPWGERSFYVKDPFGNPLCFADERTVFTGGRFIA
jgi:uncharacterized glyoxalase superfamily protein PhnB